MAVTVINPYGQATSQGFAFTPVASVTWNPGISAGVSIFNGNLTVEARGGSAGQGTSVHQKFAKSSNPNGKPIYWETTWTGLLGVSLLIGIGVIDTDAFVGAVSTADFAAVYNAFAIDGTNGCLIRPSGEVCINGHSQGTPLMGDGFPFTQQQDDVVGFELTMGNPSQPVMSFYRVAGPSAAGGNVGGLLFFGNGADHLPASGNFVPCAVFDTSSFLDIWILTANFGAVPNSLIGPFSSPLAGEELVPSQLNCGWPT